MSLTHGIGPFARPPQGQLNGDIWSVLPAHALYCHPEPRRIRGSLGDTTVLETDNALMLHETGLLPVWYVPVHDFAIGVLERTGTQTHCPFKGDASYYDLRVGGTLVRDAVWFYANPVPGAAELAGLCSIRMDALDQWFEEDQQVHGHPTDPFHRVNVRASARHVVVRAGDTVLADSTAPLAVFETGLPTRYYLAASDINTGLLSESATTTYCPYKGTAHYWNAGRHDDACWGYPDPHDEVRAAAGLRCFLGEGITTTVDGVEL